ncbi:thioredoxin reductase-like selenoprotein T homolog CG3887 [Bemisia tabaci]|uniref:thioredoxin reductase-like selenoprotein T homolog CG3887 n=1 Tax=Bemisia tabaci TaxID=7038 RepID=UPI0008F9CC44|nr:PREDICTED: selT-like protein [Bemisia tabaci]
MVDNSKLVCAVLFLFFAAFTMKDVFVNSAEKEIPVSKVSLAANNVGPSLQFLYCYSCGYRKAFDEYSTIIQQKYPEINVYGGNYEPSSFHMYLAKAFGIGKILLIICVLCNVNPFSILIPQSVWLWCVNNKIYACNMIFFLTNVIESNLVSTGAFEIFLNDIPVWSKLETGRIPQPPELFQIIDSHLQFKDTVEFKDSFPK